MPLQLRGEYSIAKDEDRIGLIAGLIEEGSQSPYIRELTLKILKAAHAKEKNAVSEINAIFNWVKKNVDYRKDVVCRDSYHKAERVAQLGGGDCDDMVILINSMLGSVGYHTGLRIMSMRKNMPFHHIYSLVRLPSGKWLALDATDKTNDIGEEPNWAKKRDFIITCAR